MPKIDRIDPVHQIVVSGRVVWELADTTNDEALTIRDAVWPTGEVRVQNRITYLPTVTGTRVVSPGVADRISIPLPTIHTGPKHQTPTEAAAEYLFSAAARVRTGKIWGSGVSALVADVLTHAAIATRDATKAETEAKGATDE